MITAEYKLNSGQAVDTRAEDALQKFETEFEKWMDAKIKAAVPAWVYRYAHSKDPVKEQRAGIYMARNGFNLVVSDNKPEIEDTSMVKIDGTKVVRPWEKRELYFGGKKIGEFKIEISNGYD